MLKRVLCVVLLVAGFAGAEVIYVSGDVSGTWSADTVMVTAQIRVPNGQTLTIEPGVYVVFQGNYKFIVDTSATLLAIGTETDSIYFDDLTPGAYWHGIRFLSASDLSELRYCHLKYGMGSGSGSDSYGGAIYCDHCSPTIEFSLIDSCLAIRGGAIYLTYSNATIFGNKFFKNAYLFGSSSDGGGAIYCNYANPIIENNIFINNWGPPTGNGGALYYTHSNGIVRNNSFTGGSTSSGGAIITRNSSGPLIEANAFESNTASYGGGALYIENGNPDILSNNFTQNMSNNGGSIYYLGDSAKIFSNVFDNNQATQKGGGIYNGGMNCEITSNLFRNNTAAMGAGIFVYYESFNIWIETNTFVNNTATAQGGGIYADGSQTIVNCILWDNHPDQIYDHSYWTVVTHCDIQGGFPGTGNINADPLFVTGPDGNYYLSQIVAGQSQQSPCVDAGAPNTANFFVGTTRTDEVLDENGFSDMGFHYNARLDFVIALTPVSPPIQIPSQGGSFNYLLAVTNESHETLTREIWCSIALPNGDTISPTFGPMSLTLAPGAIYDTTLSYYIPGSSPGGNYIYNGYAGIYPSNIWSAGSFPVIKLAMGTHVSGNVSGSFTIGGSPYIVDEDITVPIGQELFIQAGVEVLFMDSTKLVIDSNATLIAAGIETDTILFAPYAIGMHWQGIRFRNATSLSQLSYCRITRTSGAIDGGGISCRNSNITIQNCLVDSCIATNAGGGICCDNSNATISNCTITKNIAPWGAGVACIYNSVPEICENIITYNETSGMDAGGGGIYCTTNSDATIMDNVICNNATHGSALGGGICCINVSPTIQGNTISENEAHGAGTGHGAGIYCENSDALIKGNLISEGNVYGYGAGLYFADSDPVISGNIIKGNSTESGDDYGAGIYCTGSNPIMTYNIIYDNGEINTCDYGGGMYAIASNPYISHNIISKNATYWDGGGLSIHMCPNPVIINNIVNENSTRITGNIGIGGGIYCGSAGVPLIERNVIFNNTSWSVAGLYLDGNASTMVRNNTVYGNISVGGGTGGISLSSSGSAISNCIVWNNVNSQIYAPIQQVTYNDVMGGFAGVGNINRYPIFADTAFSDYRLVWGSPCIDMGDPDPIYNDPDSTRSDMGAFYYDQSMPVRILLSPHEIPYLFPEIGGTMDYTIRTTNISAEPKIVTVWCDVTLPDSSVCGPVLGPVTITLDAGTTITKIRTQNVPGIAPMGVYLYNAYAVVDGDTSKDSFIFGKLDTAMIDVQADWTNTGEPLEEAGISDFENAVPTVFSLGQNYPNPCKTQATIRFGLPKTTHVNLSIYDIAGQLVANLVNENREAGYCQIPFNGSDLSAGVYIYRLETDEFTATRKMVILK